MKDIKEFLKKNNIEFDKDKKEQIERLNEL